METDIYQRILDILATHFSNPDTIHKLEILSAFADGFENWFQIETIVSLTDNEIYASTLGKKAFDADVVINYKGNEVGIELRCWSGKGFSDNMLKALVDHPNADSYLFLFKNDENKLSKLLARLTHRKAIHARLNSEWIIMLVK